MSGASLWRFCLSGRQKKVHMRGCFFLLATNARIEAMKQELEFFGNAVAEAAELNPRSKGAGLRQTNRHKVPIEFWPKSLKTNDGHTHQVSHFFGVRQPVFFSLSVLIRSAQGTHAA
jgi:hypothetical protein